MAVELHAASAFSFLRSSSAPEDLVAHAAELGYQSLALVDRDAVAGAPRFFKAAQQAGIRPLVGAELTLRDGGVLPLLVESRAGYRNLCELITDMKAGVGKGEGRIGLEQLEGKTSGLVALAGVETLCGHEDRLEALIRIFGKPSVTIDVQRHRRREQEARNQAVLDLADSEGLLAVATNGVRHATRRRPALLDVMTCIREKTTLQAAGRLLSENAERHLKPPAQMKALFADRPDLVENAEALGERLQFTLADLGYKFPDYPLPADETMFEH